MKFLYLTNGVATLPTILALAVVILAIGVGVSTIGFTETFITAGGHDSVRALYYAESGAGDALLRITRDKTYSCAPLGCYEIEFVPNGCVTNEGCVRVSVSSGVGSLLDPKIITSRGEVENKIREIQVEIVFDASGYGEFLTTDWSEVVN